MLLLFSALATAAPEPGAPPVCPAVWPGPVHSGAAWLVAKAERSLGLYEDGVLGSAAVGGVTTPACFSIGLAVGAEEGPKRERGDLKTPEGLYRLTHRNPKSQYYKSLGLSYPNADDVRASLALNVISAATAQTALTAIASNKTPSQKTGMGGDIFVHGMGSASDWTLGCIAVDNVVMDLLYLKGNPGTPVWIVPNLPPESP